METENFIEIIKRCDFNYRKYSGRAMYGKECIAIDSDSSNTYSITLQLIQSCEDMEEVYEMCDILQDTRIDSMGVYYVVYFPKVKVDNNMKIPKRVYCENCDEEYFITGETCPRCNSKLI